MEFKILKEITTKIASGSTPRGGKNSYTDSGPIALIRSQNIYNNNFTRNGLVYINNEQAKKLSNVEINKDDILINITGDSVARVTMVDSTVLPARINQHVMILRPEESMVNKYYLLAYLSSNIAQESLKHLASDGATRAALTKRDLETFKIPNLSFENQEYIGNLLKYINKKIEVNKNIIANLEELSQTLFKRWFIDFEFPDENGDPYKSSGGEMVDSELGEIPKEWSIQTLNDISESYNTKRKPLSKLEREKVTSIYPYYGATKIIDYVDDYLFDGKFILVGEDGTVQTEEGHPFVQYVWGKFWVSNHAHILKGNNLSDETLMLILNNIDIEPYITGAVQPKISKKNLNGIKVIIGTKLIYEKFDQYSDIYYKKIREISEEIKNLIELRDTLLPKLMSGELEIPDDIEVNEDELSI
ncbi:restriction endonuclease subunit S [Staphylococcus sp. IPLA37010]|uniref:Restriction endonuclease subunit S n=1 Tax=Staphylococcus equorum TaxID=246432 RepID=A0AAW7AHC2_9STAP|nr:restriction endonuclease subunit S [Staphylococcus equorum]MDK9866259.1 restriction endonuclease subunit S [Staphylococcus equorum]